MAGYAPSAERARATSSPRPELLISRFFLDALFGGTPVAPADLVVVLGCALGPDGGPGRALRERLEAGAGLFREGLAPTLLVTGGRRWRGRVEADAMVEWLEGAGVPRASILMERRSLTTRENARWSAPLIRSMGLGSLLVVTQPLHLRRAVRAFEDEGLEARGVVIRGSYQLAVSGLRSTGKDLGYEAAATLGELLSVRPPWRAG